MTICLDGRTVAGDLCRTHRDDAAADIEMHMFSMTELPGHELPVKDHPVSVVSHRTMPARDRVPVIRARREEHVQEELAVGPHVPTGVDLVQLQRATDQWTMPSGVRSKLQNDDIDPVDVFLVAGGNGKEYPGDDGETAVKTGNDLTVLLDHTRYIILGARKNYRRQGQ